MWKFQKTKWIMAICSCHGLLYPFHRGMMYLLAWAIACYLWQGPSTTSVPVMAIVPTLFPFPNMTPAMGAGRYKDNNRMNILVLRNAFEKTRKQMKVNALSINALSDNLNFPMFAKLTLKKT